jgi:hyperosmotically inducible periplasmic protein
MKVIARVAFLTVLFAGALSMNLAILNAAPGQDQSGTAPDNTKVNKQDQPTADQQKENTSDRETTRQIRRAIIKDKSLSTYAHNIKIITQGGMVTLKGPVRSDEEKQAIEAKAKEVAGADKVTSDLEVKPKT